MTKKKFFMLNLNHYRNAHFRTLDKAKKTFKDLVAPLIRHLPAFPQVQITYTYFAPSQQLSDISNVTAIVDKFFCDALVECGKLTDDNRTVVLSTRSCFGGVDKTNPRVEATIELPGTTNPEAPFIPSQHRQENDLKITIIQHELEEAVRNHVRSIIAVKEGMDITMSFSATRGDDGLTAYIDILPAKEDDKAPATITTQAKAPASVVEEKAAPAPAPARQTRAHTPAPEKASTERAKTEPEEDKTSSQLQAGGPGDAQHEAEETEGATPLKASIFSSLRRPDNSGSEAAAVEAA